MRRFLLALVACSLAVASTDLAAQAPRRWAVGAALGVANVGMTRGSDTRGGRAGHVQVGLERMLTPTVSAVLSLDAYAMGSAQAIPSCLPSTTSCGPRTTLPGLLLGSSVGLAMQPTDELSLLGTVGAYTGPDIEGTQERSSAAVSLGADIALPWRSRFAPLLTVRYVYFTTPLAGVRSLVGPGAGIGF